MRSSSRHRGRSSHGPREGPADAGSAGGPVRRNAPPEARRSDKPGTGTPHRHALAVTVRRRSRWRTRSGRVRRDWEIMFEPTSAPTKDPITGRMQATDPLGGHRVAFHTADAAVAFAERRGWRVRVVGDREPDHSPDDSHASDDGPSADDSASELSAMVDETLRQSFPASDPASWTLGRNR